MIEYKKQLLIKSITSYTNPPWDDNDMYFMRYPWNLLGGVSSGLYEHWVWFRDDIIDKQCDVETLEYALELLKEG